MCCMYASCQSNHWKASVHSYIYWLICARAIHSISVYDHRTSNDSSLLVHASCQSISHVTSILQSESLLCEYVHPSDHVRCSPHYVIMVGHVMHDLVTYYYYDNVVIMYTGETIIIYGIGQDWERFPKNVLMLFNLIHSNVLIRWYVF